MNQLISLKNRLKRSLAKKLLGFVGLPRECEAYNYIDGIWSKPLPPFSSRCNIYNKGSFIVKSQSFKELKKSLCLDSSVYIIGSGPSIREQDIGKLKSKNTILLNGAINLIESSGIDPIMIVVTDSSFIRNRFEIIKAVPPNISLALQFSVVREILLRIPDFFESRSLFLLREREERISIEPVENRRFLETFSEIETFGVLHSGTVMSAAIQIAAYLKFSKIFLLGFDIGNANLPRFYETDNNKVRCGLLNDYEKEILPFMRLTKEYFDKCKNQHIWNCSPSTLLPYEIIPYFDFEESLKE